MIRTMEFVKWDGRVYVAIGIHGEWITLPVRQSSASVRVSSVAVELPYDSMVYLPRWVIVL